MVVVHWGGDPADVAELAEASGLPASAVIEDAGQALGASLDERAVGALGVGLLQLLLDRQPADRRREG